MRALLVLLLLGSVPAHAEVPAQLTTQGRILNEDAQPLEGEVGITFRLMDAASGGSTLWEERQDVTVDNGFYAVVLGADEAGNPIEDDLLDQWPVWLELQLDDAPAMVPRMSVGSVPFARIAGTASELAPGAAIDVESLSVGGTEVVAADGAWSGPTPEVSWTDLSDVPADFWDGDDADALADLVCTDGQWARWDAASAAWACDGFSDTTRTDADIRSVVEGAAVDLYAGSTMDGYTLLTAASSLDWSLLTGVPSGLDDGDDADTLADLSCASDQIAVWSGTAWGCGDDNTLTEAEVEDYITNDVLDLPSGTTVGGAALATAVPARIIHTEGNDFYCVLNTDNHIACSGGFWGQGAIGEVLDATADWESTRSTIEVCALDTAGTVSCYSMYGVSNPITGTGYSAIAGVEDDGCALDSAGSATCWGSASLSGAFDTIRGNSTVVCGITTAGALECSFPGRSYTISDSGPWDWVDVRSSSVCAGDTTGATYCWLQTAAGVTRYGLAGTWDTFSGHYSSSLGGVYGCGVLPTGGLRCVYSNGTTIDHAGSWSDAVWTDNGHDNATPHLLVGVTDSGVLFAPRF